MFWVPPSIVLLFFVARLIELGHRFRAQPGRILYRWTFIFMTAAGAVTVLAGLAEYGLGGGRASLGRMALGVGMAVAAFALRHAARRALARMWSVHVEIREAHTLVRDGPYRYLRHPIYVGMMVEVAAALVVLGSWRVAVPGLLLNAAAVAARVRAEEQAMARQLGERWAEYCRTTGAFLPLW